TCFFFQPEDGIRFFHVTGVQTCALPILPPEWSSASMPLASEIGRWITTYHREGRWVTDASGMLALLHSGGMRRFRFAANPQPAKIARASCRERASSLSRAESVSAHKTAT